MRFTPVAPNACIYAITCNTTKKSTFNNQSFIVILFVLSLGQSNLQKIIIISTAIVKNSEALSIASCAFHNPAQERLAAIVSLPRTSRPTFTPNQFKKNYTFVVLPVTTLSAVSFQIEWQQDDPCFYKGFLMNLSSQFLQPSSHLL